MEDLCNTVHTVFGELKRELIQILDNYTHPQLPANEQHAKLEREPDYSTKRYEIQSRRTMQQSVSLSAEDTSVAQKVLGGERGSRRTFVSVPPSVSDEHFGAGRPAFAGLRDTGLGFMVTAGRAARDKDLVSDTLTETGSALKVVLDMLEGRIREFDRLCSLAMERRRYTYICERQAPEKVVWTIRTVGIG